MNVAPGQREPAEQVPSADLTDRDWLVSYSHEDGDLVEMFYVPILSRATVYRRATGYFSGSVMALAARGLDALIDRGGRMELLVGCTLTNDDVEEIQKGYDVREAIGRSYANKLVVAREDAFARQHIGYLAWMIAHGHLDVKLGIPIDERGKFQPGVGLYHAKMGLVVDGRGHRLVFRGSINETEAGWRHNHESFDVNCSWRGGCDRQRVEKAEAEFATLWANRARRVKVVEFPEALRERLLEFLPKEIEQGGPMPAGAEQPDGQASDVEIAPPAPEEPTLPPDERCRLVWSFLANAAKRPDDGPSFTVATSTVRPWPHQLRAFKRMLDGWPFRLLIADEVGLGKTIEAGLIIRHACVAGLAKRILILTPAGVMGQWQAELYEKFNLLVPYYKEGALHWPEHHFCRRDLKVKAGRTEWTREPVVIASSQLMRRQDRQRDLLDADPWDLVVLDEAHHARRKGAGTPQERGPNRLLSLMQHLKDRTQALLLMTATPMQVHPVEIWDLLNLLGLPEEWDEETFCGYFERLSQNPDAAELHRLAQLFQATERKYGSFDDDLMRLIGKRGGLSTLQQKKIVGALREPSSTIPLRRLTTPQRQAAAAILRAATPVRRLMSRHTRNLLRRYYELGLLESPIARREPIDDPIDLSPQERNLYEAVENYISRVYQGAEPGRKKAAVGFVMTIYRRRLASSFYALKQTLNDRLARLEGLEQPKDELRLLDDALEDDLEDEAMDANDVAALEREALVLEEKDEIRNLLKSIAKLGTDSKARRLLDLIREHEQRGYDSCIVFTQYTDTMDFLKEFLGDRLDVPIGCYSGRGGEQRDAGGRWVPCSKDTIKRRLREGKIKILLCTDAAGEGLNLQYCGALINYDLPWNPMKVEQRIGRVDRIGQRHPIIRIVNLAYANTVEADIYFRLSQRINLFHGVVGKLQPILARLPKAFEAAVLVHQGERERARHEAVQQIEDLVVEAEQSPFDIDEVSELELTPPEFPEPPAGPEVVERILGDPDLLPAGVECRELDPHSFALTLPGETEPARVTASPELFEEHAESHQMVAPMSPVFERLVELAGVDEVDVESESILHLLPGQPGSGGPQAAARSSATGSAD